MSGGPLTGLRVLELADEKNQFCGKLMADLGADVIVIEPPGGAAHSTPPRTAKALSSIPRTYRVTPVPLYQGASPSGSVSRRRMARNCRARDRATPAA